MPIGPARMPLLDHLGELRRRLTIIVVALFISVCVLYLNTGVLVEILISPIREFLPTGELNFMDPLSGFSMRFKIALYASVIVTFPLILWEILAFFLPALKENERKWVLPTTFVGIALFIFGTVFCYAVILQAAFGWMIGESNVIGEVLPNATTYMKLIIQLEVAFGVAFELPLIVFYLIVFRIVPYRTLRQQWRYIYVGLLTLCAMVTPDASPVTMAFMFAVLLAMYELAMLVGRLVLGRRIKKMEEEGTFEPTDGEIKAAEKAAEAAAKKKKKA